MAKQKLRTKLVMASLLATLVGCAMPIDDGSDESVGEASDAVKTEICPAIAILCIEGYKPKKLPQCNQMCIPDNQQGWECNSDKDCGPIYCVTTPCPQPVCQGHKCKLPNANGNNGNGGGPPPGVGKACGENVCTADEYCCNESCGICAPEGGFCIQIACSPS